MIDEMPYDELIGWMAYLDERPIGWREDLRTYRFLQTQGAKEKPGAYFPSLAMLDRKSKPQVSPDGEIRTVDLKSSGLWAMLQKAGGLPNESETHG
jgi:hypothetical protein